MNQPFVSRSLNSISNLIVKVKAGKIFLFNNKRNAKIYMNIHRFYFANWQLYFGMDEESIAAKAFSNIVTSPPEYQILFRMLKKSNKIYFPGSSENRPVNDYIFIFIPHSFFHSFSFSPTSSPFYCFSFTQ